MLTVNEKQVLRFLAASIGKDYSINDIARECKLTPNGAYKLLSKWEKEDVLNAKTIANIRSYKLNFENEKTRNILNLAFMATTLQGRIKLRTEDLKPLKSMTQICIIFGSYTTAKKNPADLDIVFVLEKKNFEKYKQMLSKVQEITPIKIQDIIQTTKDLEQNIKKKDPVIAEVIKKGIVLWGFDVLVKVIANVSE
ncbi:MAG: hypothetical protein Q8L34_05980 [Candidatus Woesearchaeota archaeon]|nr:hypothetical protein [Candidatus Woesearchaeota archaeon]